MHATRRLPRRRCRRPVCVRECARVLSSEARQARCEVPERSGAGGGADAPPCTLPVAFPAGTAGAPCVRVSVRVLSSQAIYESKSKHLRYAPHTSNSPAGYTRGYTLNALRIPGYRILGDTCKIHCTSSGNVSDRKPHQIRYVVGNRHLKLKLISGPPGPGVWGDSFFVDVRVYRRGCAENCRNHTFAAHETW